VQRAVSKVRVLPSMHWIYRGDAAGWRIWRKEDQANVWAALCALACLACKKAGEICHAPDDDMVMTGKRHPYSSDFKIGLIKTLKILAYEVTFYQNAGAAADLSPTVLERTLFHLHQFLFLFQRKGHCL